MKNRKKKGGKGLEGEAVQKIMRPFRRVGHDEGVGVGFWVSGVRLPFFPFFQPHPVSCFENRISEWVTVSCVQVWASMCAVTMVTKPCQMLARVSS